MMLLSTFPWWPVPLENDKDHLPKALVAVTPWNSASWNSLCLLQG